MDNLLTSLVFITPHEVQAHAIPLLKAHAPDSQTRIPAHMTIMYPFVPFDQLANTARKLREICSQIEPFELTLAGYGTFPGAVYMQLVNPEPFKAMYRTIFAAFPDYPPYRGVFGDDLHPHVTVAEWLSESAQEAGIQRPDTLPPYDPITFRVERLHLMYGVEHPPLPYITYEVIPLGYPPH